MARSKAAPKAEGALGELLFEGLNGLLVVVTGPSGVGKSSLIKGILEQRTDVDFVPSVTTRKRRPGEIEGRSYRFLKEQDFEALVAQGELLEWQEVFNSRYGVATQDVRERLESGLHGITDLEVKGAHEVALRVPLHSVLVFISPPDLASLEGRLRARRSEEEGFIGSRLERAVWELSLSGLFDYLIVNEDLESAAEELGSIISAETVRFRLGREIWRQRKKVGYRTVRYQLTGGAWMGLELKTRLGRYEDAEEGLGRLMKLHLGERSHEDFRIDKLKCVGCCPSRWNCGGGEVIEEEAIYEAAIENS